MIIRKVHHVLQVREAAKELGYQPDETFCLKISQLREIFEVRWSVFLLGPAGCGKSAIWKTLMRAQQNFGEKTVYKPINPKVSQLHASKASLTSLPFSIIIVFLAYVGTNKDKMILRLSNSTP